MYILIGLSDVPYSPESLNTALESLHGFYRTGPILNHCQHIDDYKNLVTIMTIDKQWPEVCVLYGHDLSLYIPFSTGALLEITAVVL